MFRVVVFPRFYFPLTKYTIFIWYIEKIIKIVEITPTVSKSIDKIFKLSFFLNIHPYSMQELLYLVPITIERKL